MRQNRAYFLLPLFFLECGCHIKDVTRAEISTLQLEPGHKPIRCEINGAEAKRLAAVFGYTISMRGVAVLGMPAVDIKFYDKAQCVGEIEANTEYWSDESGPHFFSSCDRKVFISVMKSHFPTLQWNESKGG